MRKWHTRVTFTNSNTYQNHEFFLKIRNARFGYFHSFVGYLLAQFMHGIHMIISHRSKLIPNFPVSLSMTTRGFSAEKTLHCKFNSIPTTMSFHTIALTIFDVCNIVSQLFCTFDSNDNSAILMTILFQCAYVRF